MEGLERILPAADVVVIELALLDFDKAVLCVEAIRLTAAQCTNVHLKVLCIGLGEDASEHGGTDAPRLVLRTNVQMFKH